MNQPNKNVEVQLSSSERKYVRVYHDFLDNSFLTTEEQMIFIVLKSYVDFKEDSGELYPSMETICKRAKMSEKRARKNINSLIKKGIAKKVQRGLSKTNLYTLSDYAKMWACDNTEDITAIVDNEGERPLTTEECISILERRGYEVKLKKKEPVSGSGQTSDTSTYIDNLNLHNDNTDKSESQERYPMPDLKDFFEYEALIDRYPEKQVDIDIIFDLLYDTVNTKKPTIRVNGEDKERNVVIGKLMKLQFEDFPYVINKYHEQTGRIKNVKAYLLTILYHAREQSHLDMMNLGHHNGDF